MYGFKYKDVLYKTCISCREKRNKKTTVQTNVEEHEAVVVEQETKLLATISLDATDIAIILGENPFNDDICSRVIKYWQRGFNKDYFETYNAVWKENATVEIIEAVDFDTQILRLCADKNITVDYSTPDAVDETVKSIQEHIHELTSDAEISDDTESTNDEHLEHRLQQIETLSDKIKTYANQQMGITCEEKALVLLENQLKTHITRTNNKYVFKQFYTTPNAKWCVGGKIDGILNEDTIVEVKTRKNRFYNRTYENELMQMSTYMFAKDYRKCMLVQYFNDKIKSDEHYYNNARYTQYLNRLKSFCDDLESFLNNTEIKHKIMETHIFELNEEHARRTYEELLLPTHFKYAY